LKTSANDSEHNKESNEPDYNEDEDQLGEEQTKNKEGRETRDIYYMKWLYLFKIYHFISIQICK
jgi:hypothetical protein